MSIIYLHGFNSAGWGHTATTLKNLYPKETILSPSYSFWDANLASQEIEKVIKTEMAYESNAEVFLVGSSLGGFWTNYFSEKFQLKAVLINPAVAPQQSTAKYIGENENLKTGDKYIFSQENADTYSRYISTNKFTEKAIILSVNDEVIDYKIAEKFFSNHSIFLSETEKHRFADDKLLKKVTDLMFFGIKD